MADAQTEDRMGFVDKRWTFASQSNAISTTSLGGNMRDVGALRARLAAINGTFYTAAILNQMTMNDMIYAVRINDEAAGLNW